ncbi:hypothetical protein [Bdellovibrio bacteriovorus]|uniref:hypothetical protein n=1 Tax=Bdellovibrio bacteriovorus TaxID=959 RepID=UPI0035A5C070
MKPVHAAVISALVGLLGLAMAGKLSKESEEALIIQSSKLPAPVSEGAEAENASDSAFKKMLVNKLTRKLDALNSQLDVCDKDLAAATDSAYVSRAQPPSDDVKTLGMLIESSEKDLAQCQKELARSEKNGNKTNARETLARLQEEIYNINNKIYKCNMSLGRENRWAYIDELLPSEDATLEVLQAQIARAESIKASRNKELIHCAMRADSQNGGGDDGDGTSSASNSGAK